VSEVATIFVKLLVRPAGDFLGREGHCDQRPEVVGKVQRAALEKNLDDAGFKGL
jgi:hypothetical protein